MERVASRENGDCWILTQVKCPLDCWSSYYPALEEAGTPWMPTPHRVACFPCLRDRDALVGFDAGEAKSRGTAMLPPRVLLSGTLVQGHVCDSI